MNKTNLYLQENQRYFDNWANDWSMMGSKGPGSYETAPDPQVTVPDKGCHDYKRFQR